MAAAVDALACRDGAAASIAGGGVHYSLAEAELAAFAERHGIPVVETVAGKSQPDVRTIRATPDRSG